MDPEGKPTTIYLIRHGQTEDNVKKVLQGSGMQGKLSVEGIEQAGKLRKWAEGKEISAVYHSSLQRSRHTAQLAFPKHVLFCDERATEIDYGALTERKFDEAAKEIVSSGLMTQADYEKIISSNKRLFYIEFAGSFDGETITHMYARGISLLQDIAKKHPGGNVAVVSHGAFNLVLVCGLLGVPFSQNNFYRYHMDNCAITKITVEADKITIDSVNETGHLK